MKGRPAAMAFVSTGAAGRACGVTATAIKKWIREGKVQAFRTPGGHFRIPVEEVTRLTSTHRESR